MALEIIEHIYALVMITIAILGLVVAILGLVVAILGLVVATLAAHLRRLHDHDCPPWARGSHPGVAFSLPPGGRGQPLPALLSPGRLSRPRFSRLCRLSRLAVLAYVVAAAMAAGGRGDHGRPRAGHPHRPPLPRELPAETSAQLPPPGDSSSNNSNGDGDCSLENQARTTGSRACPGSGAVTRRTK
ncbi:hypothetical protein MY3296_007649 [Beauveria thailandica]